MACKSIACVTETGCIEEFGECDNGYAIVYQDGWTCGDATAINIQDIGNYFPAGITNINSAIQYIIGNFCELLKQCSLSNLLGDRESDPPAANYIPVWNGTEWVAGNFCTVMQNAACSINALGDVNAPAPGVGQVLTWNGTNWVPGAAGGSVTISPDANNCLTSRGNGLYVGCVDVLQNSGNELHTDPTVYVGPTAIQTIHSVSEVINNPSTTQTMHVQFVSVGSIEINNITGTPNVNVSHRLLVDGVVESATIGENGQTGIEYGWAGSATYTVSIPPGGSATFEIQNRLTLPVGGTTVNGPTDSRLGFSWQAILV